MSKKMTLEEIQELIKFVAKSGATEVDLEFEGVKISIKSPPKKRRGKPDDPIEIVQKETSMQTVAAPVITETLKTAIPTATVTQSTAEDDSKYITIKASMIGTFYRSSGPEKDAFVNVGDEIKEGDAICIIEAMKLFNEIESEISGKIVKVLVDDNTPVEFDQPLFLVDPS
jgi:acetyl-CoA carboxylase biotin carboxyl carrier protein